MNKKETTTIIRKVVMEADRQDLLSLLDDLEEGIFEKSNTNGELLDQNKKFGSELSEFLKTSLSDRDLLTSDLVSLREEIKSLPSADITLAIAPSEKIMAAITAWVASLTQKTLLNIIVKPEIIGGVIVAVGGFYKDASLAKKLEDAFLKKHDQIETLLIE